MISTEEAICKITNELSEKIDEMTVSGDIIILKESPDYDLYTSEVKSLLHITGKRVEYSNDAMTEIKIDLRKDMKNEDLLSVLVEGHSGCESLISISKKPDKIVIIVERGEGWSAINVRQILSPESYKIKEFENTDGNWEIDVFFDNFNILGLKNSELEELVKDLGEVMTVSTEQVNDTIAISFEDYVSSSGLKRELNLPRSVQICTYKTVNGYLYIINKAQIREAYED